LSNPGEVALLPECGPSRVLAKRHQVGDHLSQRRWVNSIMPRTTPGAASSFEIGIL
jgi:hypothetical protein